MVGRKPSQEIAGSGGLVQLPGAASGTKSAYMGQNSNNNGSNVASVQHFYRDIAIPSTATHGWAAVYLKRTTASASDRFRVLLPLHQYAGFRNFSNNRVYGGLFG